jgi:hypothetical protein
LNNIELKCNFKISVEKKNRNIDFCGKYPERNKMVININPVDKLAQYRYFRRK